MAKKGGTFFGNLLASVANKVTGGLLGAKRVAALKSGNLASINPDATKVGKMLQAQIDAEKQITFAGQPATQSADGTISMQQPLNTVTITPQGVNPADPDTIWEKIKGKVSELGFAASKDTKFGIDDNLKWLVGGGIAAVVIAIVATSGKK